MKNIWLNTNRPLVESLKRTLIEASYQPMYQEFPIKKLQFVFNGFETEINRLENENNALKARIKELENQMKDETPDPVPDINKSEDPATPV